MGDVAVRSSLDFTIGLITDITGADCRRTREL